MDSRPIGIFDSGVGGLTVAREVMKQLPKENIIYFGDLARLPYGSKSKENIILFSKQIVNFLIKKDVKAIIVACNTATAFSMAALKETFDIPITGVVQPGSLVATQRSQNKRIGVIGTEGTIHSAAYQKAINYNDPEIKVFEKACPLLVPLVEEGWFEDEITREIVKRYVGSLIEEDIDTLVLGCTHYPLLKSTIQKVVGDNVCLINPAKESAKKIKEYLEINNQLGCHDENNHLFYVTDRTEKFEQLARQILKQPMLPVEKVQID